jgi:hypothetical protein
MEEKNSFDIQADMEDYKLDRDYWESEIYKSGREDKIFMSDTEGSQWDSKVYQARLQSGRPALQIDKLEQVCNQVINDARMNTPTINVIPGGKNSDPETAEIIKGKIKDIEYSSDADTAYDTAINNSVMCSIGFIRVDHDYEDDESFDQKLIIERVVNPFAIYLDRNSVKVDGSDAMSGRIIEEISVKEFKRKYPDLEPVSYGEDRDCEYGDEDYINICECFKVDIEQETITDELTGKERTREKRTVRRYKLSGKDILEEGIFPGIYVPIVPVYGKEHWENGKRKVFSLIRKAKDPQRQFNGLASLEMEFIANHPKQKWSGDYQSFEGFEEHYLDSSKTGILPFDSKDGKVAPPQLVPPPPIPASIINSKREAVEDIKAATGIYDASLGARSNETSGVAINQRKMEGDVATYHFSDNLVKSIAQVGRILVNAMPDIYDTDRELRIIDDEENPKTVGINNLLLPDQERPYDLRKGRYDVKVVTGASFTTQRQEAAAFYSEIVKSNPDLMQVMGDLLFKNMDFTGAQGMAERMKKVIDPKFLDEEDREGQDPEKMQMMQAIELLKAELQKTQAELQDKKQSESAKLQLEAAKLKAETEKTQLEAQLREREMLMEADQEQRQSYLEAQKIALEREKLMAEIRARETQPTEIR